MATKKQLPVWAQVALVWFVMSSLSAFGLLYLRAGDTVGDAIFQPLVRVVCSAGDRLETSYVQTTVRIGRDGRTRGLDAQRGVRHEVFSLGAATCVAADGTERPASRFAFAVWAVFALAWGVLSFAGWRRQPR